MLKKHSFFGLILGMAFQIAFGMGFCGFVYYCLSEDEDAVKFFPIVFTLLWIFWLPFIIRNCWVYIKEWRAEKLGIDVINGILPGPGPSGGSDGPKSEQEQLEEERRQRERENREWQERVTREQRQQNQRLNEEQDRRAEQYRSAKAEQERIRREQEDRLYRLAEKYYTNPDPDSVRRAFDRSQELEENIGKAYENAAKISGGVETGLDWANKGSEAAVNVAAEKEKCPVGPMHIIKNVKDLVKPRFVDSAESLANGDYRGALKGFFLTGPAKGIMNVIQNYNPVSGLNVGLEALKAKADCWRMGLDGNEAKDYIERKTAARKVYENTGKVLKFVTGDETLANSVKEVSSNLFTNDAAESYTAKQQAKRAARKAKSPNPKPSSYIQNLQNKIKSFNQTQKKIDLR